MRGLFLLCLHPVLGLEMGIEMFKEILNFPLRKNPFFAKITSLSGNFAADGIEDGTADVSGYVCQYLGNLECEDNYDPQCSGLGVIDCAGDCSGTEEEFKEFMKVMEDEKFDEKYPNLARAKNSQKNKEMSMKAENKMEEIQIETNKAEEGEKKEPKDDIQTQFVKGLMKCTNFSQETKNTLKIAYSLAEGDGFNQDTDDPNSAVFVDKGALSNIADIEYDYSDLYAEYEDENDQEEHMTTSQKSRRDISDDAPTTTTTTTTTTITTSTITTLTTTTTTTTHSTTTATTTITTTTNITIVNTVTTPTIVSESTIMSTKNSSAVQKIAASQSPEFVARLKLEEELKKKAAYIQDLSDVENLTEEQKVNMNVIRSAGDEDSKSEPIKMEERNETENKLEDVNKRIKRELVEVVELVDLKEIFQKTMEALKSDEGPFKKPLPAAWDPYSQRLAWKIKHHLRLKRETKIGDNKSEPNSEACVVKNMTCIKFPSRKHCTGIALGRCGSRTDLLAAMLAALFTPHVLMVTIVSVFVIVIVTMGLSYYCYRLKSENNKVMPQDESENGDEDDPKNGQVMTVQPAPNSGDPPPA